MARPRKFSYLEAKDINKDYYLYMDSAMGSLGAIAGVTFLIWAILSDSWDSVWPEGPKWINTIGTLLTAGLVMVFIGRGFPPLVLLAHSIVSTILRRKYSTTYKELKRCIGRRP